jgi:hypothetical protein
MTKKIKIYGERNTNTNYVEKIVANNLDVKQISGIAPKSIRIIQNKFKNREFVRDSYFTLTHSCNLGWKHSRVTSFSMLKYYPIVNNDLSFLTITKNPYSWLLSLYKKPYHQKTQIKQSFGEFLTTPWVTVGRDRVIEKSVTPVQLWNIKNNSYLGLQSAQVIFTTSEELLHNPKSIIESLSKNFNIKMKSAFFLDHILSTKDRNKDQAYYKDYYLNEKWQSELTNEHIKLINRQVDQHLMAFFKYKML